MLRALLYGLLALAATGVARAADAPAREPHVALLLPLNSPVFGRHAEAVRQGFVAAARVAAKDAPPVRVYPVNEDGPNVLTVYEQAVEAGARLVIGPLTRAGVAALAASSLVGVPTLALNALDGGAPQPARLYTFSLNVEEEARRIAQLAQDEGRRSALVVVEATPLGRRMRDAFAREFARRGGRVVADHAYSADTAALARLRQTTAGLNADMAFLALDETAAVKVRPYLGNGFALYATSRVNTGGADAARTLDRLRFTDMPWLLQPDHAAVMVYPRGRYEDADLERLYAFGIDAFRLGLELLRQTRNPVLDGVTGRLRLVEQRFARDALVAQFADGRTLVVGEAR